MNRSSMSKQMMSAGGKLNMVKGKDGKMVPDYAADGKGKMKAGGMAKAYNEGGGVMEDDAAKKQADADAKTRAKARAALKTTVETFSNLVTGKGGSKSKKPRRAIEAPMSAKLMRAIDALKKDKKPPRRAIEAPMSDERAKEAIAALKMDKKSKADKKSKNKPAKKMMAGGMTNKPKAKVRGYGMARGGKVCKMR